MNIFLDFDDCLFDTHAFYQGLQALFSEHGIPRNIFTETYQSMKQNNTAQGWAYSCEKHMMLLQEQFVIEDGLQPALNQYLSNTSAFLFPDVKKFLRILQRQHARIIIISFGDSDFQYRKILGTGIGLYTQKIIVTEGSKAEAICATSISQGEETWFVDDRVSFVEDVKQALPMIKTILIQRTSGRHTDIKSTYGTVVVRDCHEILQIFGYNK
ncbi:MAG: HAD family hydrolase [Minisyncoccota bacterium]